MGANDDNTEPIVYPKHGFNTSTVYNIIMPILIVIILIFGLYAIFHVNLPSNKMPMVGGGGFAKFKRYK